MITFVCIVLWFLISAIVTLMLISDDDWFEAFKVFLGISSVLALLGCILFAVL